MPILDLVKTFQFEAAHTMPHADDPARLHGHSYTLDLVVEGELDESLGWVMDYADITRAFEPVYKRLDHQTLDSLEGIGAPTLENVERWIFENAAAILPGLKSVHLRIEATAGFDAQIIRGDGSTLLPDRLRFGFEAAHALPNLPPDHKCHTMHGHSFTVEVATESLETLHGELAAIHEQLDHRCLNDIEGLENPTSENLALWIWNALAGTRGDLRAVLVAETCTARCVYHGR